MKFAYFNNEGRVETAINDQTISQIPEGAFELNDEQFANRFDLLVVENQLTISPIPPILPTLPELKAIKKAQINGAFEQTMQMITAGYPQDEIASWGKQEQEARAFVADAESATPLIGALSATRGVEKSDLVGRIIYKADAFAQISGQLIGKRQALEDAIDAAETAEALEAISW